MTEGFRTVDIEDIRNAGVEAIGETAPIGDQVLRGVPFAIGRRADRCLVALHGCDAVTIAVGRPARSVVFAHRLLDSSIPDGGPVGATVAEFTFRYAGGGEESVTVRDRLEIAALPLDWGQLPLLCFPDRFDGLPDRYQGRWEHAGYRQGEASQATPHHYVLWAWMNPEPDRSLASIEVTARGPRFVIAAVTVCDLEEHPLALPGARAVRVDFDDAARAAHAPIEMALDVDRGTSSFPYTLPAEPLDAFLADPMTGFGAPCNRGSSPAYAYVAAAPSAIVTIRDGDVALGSARWSDVLSGSDVRAGEARLRLVDPGRNWVRTTVVDDATGAPLPCRVHFRSPDGIPYAPHGHHPHVGSDIDTWHRDVGGDVRLGQMSYAYIDGTCEGWLPRGSVVVDVARGFEYEPLRTAVTIEPGQQELTLRLRRVRDMNADGWYSGDTHVHFLSTQGAHTEAAGEDLNVVNLLLSQWGHLFTNTEEFTGRPAVSPDGRTIVYASQENRQHLLGHLTLLGLKRPVMPWCTDGPSEAEMGGALEATLSEWADRCHEQGGTVILPHIPNPNGEPATLIATGRVDAVEFLFAQTYNHLEYYRYLNGGYRLPLVGGTDKMSSEVPVGLYRTYVHIPADEAFTYESWCRNLARGRTFLSAGPLLSFEVDGAIPGDVVRVRGGGRVEVRARVDSIFPVHTLQLVRNGEVIATAEDAHGARSLRLDETVEIGADSWLAVRAGGPGYHDMTKHHDVWTRGVMAHSSPVYLTCGDGYEMFSEATAHYMLTLIEGSLRYVRELSPQYPLGLVTHHHGEDDHMAHLARPFLEAREAVAERLRTRT